MKAARFEWVIILLLAPSFFSVILGFVKEKPSRSYGSKFLQAQKIANVSKIYAVKSIRVSLSCYFFIFGIIKLCTFLFFTFFVFLFIYLNIIFCTDYFDSSHKYHVYN